MHEPNRTGTHRFWCSKRCKIRSRRMNQTELVNIDLGSIGLGAPPTFFPGIVYISSCGLDGVNEPGAGLHCRHERWRLEVPPFLLLRPLRANAPSEAACNFICPLPTMVLVFSFDAETFAVNERLLAARYHPKPSSYLKYWTFLWKYIDFDNR